MDRQVTTQEQQLCELLAELPSRHGYIFTNEAAQELWRSLFWSLAGGNIAYMRLLFPDGRIPDNAKLSEAQETVEGAEYTEIARGKRCGHIFKSGEATYQCKTCETDMTCRLCSRCFDSTDHTGHMVRMSVTVGNSGCCDCGDDEAWKSPLFCTIHSDLHNSTPKGKEKEKAGLPEGAIANLRMTIGRVLDYICDVISCSPEQLRQLKTKESILKDEENSRLLSTFYSSEAEACEDFALVLWNDEKHTVEEVKEQVAQACKKPRGVAQRHAWETDAVGRSILVYLSDIGRLLEMAKILEAIRVTVTIRSARDTFREQMCGALVEWLSDISECSFGPDAHILRQTVCEEFVRPWRRGSLAVHTTGLIDDEEEDDRTSQWGFMMHRLHRGRARFFIDLAIAGNAATEITQTLTQAGIVNGDDEDNNDEDNGEDNNDEDNNDEDNHDDEDDEEAGDEDEPSGDGNGPNVGVGRRDLHREQHSPEDIGMGEADDDVSASSSVMGGVGDGETDVIMVDARGSVSELGMNWSQSDQALEEDEATIAGYPPPPPPQSQTQTSNSRRERDITTSDSEAAEPRIATHRSARANTCVPKTPGKTQKSVPRPARYWIETPMAFTQTAKVPPAEDVFQRVRLDWLLLFDLRMWKKVRTELRNLYISTVVKVPEFKRVLALRFASLYTILAQLYLVGDREPDHSIINLSVQLLTSASITAEVVKRGNFLSNLLAILYTFLTTRQVGHPWDVAPNAVLAFDSGSVVNRRMHHFYLDMRHLLSSPYVQERIRTEPRYLMQFLDLAKLHQCVGPNVRAVVEHVEYEGDSWLTAGMTARQINHQAKSIAEAFRNCLPEEMHHLHHAIRFTAKTVILYSMGAESQRFKQTEIRDEVNFKTLQDFEFDIPSASYQVVRFVVEKGPLSFYHPLHYTLAWLIEWARSLPACELKTLMSFTPQDLQTQPRLMGYVFVDQKGHKPEDYLIAMFDYPLRVCAWLAQIKANMWVRNGGSLRHQAHQYRLIGNRDVSHQRDILLLQIAMVICDPSCMLASIIDRFGMECWVKGIFEVKSEAQDDNQHLDVVEEMLHLLVVLLSDRTPLVTSGDVPDAGILTMRRNITHALCFKPLSFNEICGRLPEKYPEQEDFHRVLEEMTTFKPPEGVSDVGTFELHAKHIEDIDPYIAHYTKNQREESEMVYRKSMAKKTGKTLEEIVYEPKHLPTLSGLFSHLGQFTGTGIFAQVIYYCLLYPLVASRFTPTVPTTRLETFLQISLHLTLLAIAEDKSSESEGPDECSNSFTHTALTKLARSNFLFELPDSRTIVSLLHVLSGKEEFKASHTKIALVLKRLKQKRPRAFEIIFERLGVSIDRINTASPANKSIEEERQRRKQVALSRHAKVMEQFQQQQRSFLGKQGTLDWGSDVEEDNEAEKNKTRKHDWTFPTGTCILCQEEVDEQRLYGTFALINESLIIRQTDFQDADLVREASQAPCNLDRSAEDIRPFGIARENRRMIKKFSSHGQEFFAERQTIGRGYPGRLARPGPVASGCGHMMHFGCFETYCESTNRRHTHQVARHHPEDTRRNEFVCPLCKAAGNAFLPIAWRGLEESYPGNLRESSSFKEYIERHLDASSCFGIALSPDVTETEGEPFDFSPSNPRLTAGSMSAFDYGASIVDVLQSASLLEDGSRGFGRRSIVDDADADDEIVRELAAAYQRLRDTIRINKLPSRHVHGMNSVGGDELHSSDVLVQTVAFSISSVELQQRGIEARKGLTLLTGISEQALTHLRILCETASSYISFGIRRWSPDSQMEMEPRKDCERQYCQLFAHRILESRVSATNRLADIHTPLLQLDPFIFLVECSFGMVPALGTDIIHLVRLCYLAELAKVVHLMRRSISPSTWLRILEQKQFTSTKMKSFAQFARSVTELSYNFGGARHRSDPTEERNDPGFEQSGLNTVEGWYSFVKKYALVFLRKSLLFLYIKFGVAFNCHISSSPDADEIDRLTEALWVPTFDAMCGSLESSACGIGGRFTVEAIVAGWIQHDAQWPRRREKSSETAAVNHPGIFELVGLPRTYDTLIEASTNRKCPTTGKELTDPVICLFCAEMCCSQSTCCLRSETVDGRKMRLGGAQQHMRRCQRSIGVFLNIRKCITVFLFRQSGSFAQAPYMDKYGETDPNLRHGRPLYLNQKRYDSMIRNVVLAHGVPSLISRKLESEINNGGWDTL